MKVRELLALLNAQDPEAEMLVSTNLMLDRERPRVGVLVLPTADVETGRFHSEPMIGKRWVSLVATDAWGISPRTSPSASVGETDPTTGECLQDCDALGIECPDKNSTPGESHDGVEKPGVPFAGPVRPGGEAVKEGPSFRGGQDIPPHPNGPDQPDSATRDGGPRTGSAGEGASVSPPPIFQGVPHPSEDEALRTDYAQQNISATDEDFARVTGVLDRWTERHALSAFAAGQLAKAMAEARADERHRTETAVPEKPVCEHCGEEDSDERIYGKVDCCQSCYAGLEYRIDQLTDILQRFVDGGRLTSLLLHCANAGIKPKTSPTGSETT